MTKRKKPPQRADGETKISISMPEEMKECLVQYAKSKDMNVSQIIRHMIRDHQASYHCRHEDAEPNRPAQGKKGNHAG